MADAWGTDQDRENHVIPLDTTPMSIAEEAKRDKAMGNPTHGTRGYDDTEAFEKDTSQSY